VADTHRRVGIAMPVTPSKAVQGIKAYSVLVTTDQKWSTSAALTGQTFAQRGAWVGIFLHGDTPVAGVKIKVSGGTSANDYYFTDTAPNARTTIGGDMTGANGTGIYIGPKSLVPHSGMGGEPTNCSWPSDLGDQIPDVVFMTTRVAITTGTTTTCP